MKKYFYLAIFCIVLVSGCAAPKHYIQGVERDPMTISLYTLRAMPGFWSQYAIKTLKIDGEDAGKYGFTVAGVGLMGNAALEPGEHTFRVTFSDYDNIWLPTYIKENTHQGWYELKINTKLGKIYSPIFKFGEESKKIELGEICLVEVDYDEGFFAYRKSKDYVVCTPSSLEVIRDNSKICRQAKPGAFEENKSICRPGV